MARKLNAEEHETFKELLEKTEFSGQAINEDAFSTALGEKTKVSLKLSPQLSAWFGEDVSDLPPI